MNVLQQNPPEGEDEKAVSWMSGHLWGIVLQSEILFGFLGTKITWQVFRNMFNTNGRSAMKD